MLTDQQLDHFNTFGFLIFRQFFSPAELATLEAEYERGLTTAYAGKPFDGSQRYWTCTMGPETPLMAGLLEDERFHRPAQQLYGDDVLGLIADANRYVGHTNWHPDHNADPTQDCYGVKFAYYLDPVGAETGALRVVPGSHKQPFHQEVRNTIKQGKLDILAVPSYVCESQPGDVVAFDLRLWHASWGGAAGRRMCTFVYYNNPADPVAEAASRKRAAGFVTMNAYFGRPHEPIYHPEWLENRAGSPLRQRWIHRLDELGFLGSPVAA